MKQAEAPLGGFKDKALLYAFFGILALLALMIAISYIGNFELAALISDEKAVFERNITEQDAALNRVVFAVNDLLVFAAESRGPQSLEKIIELGQSTINHAKIPTIIDPSYIEKILGDDPLFLAERVGKSNERYHARTERLSTALERLRSSKDSKEGAAALNDFLAEERGFLEELRDHSRLLVQVAGAYHAVNRKTLVHLQTHINGNLIESSILTLLLVAVSIMFVRSRLAAERELHEHRDHLAELVAVRTGELDATNAQLRKALEDKEALIKEVYHRVKNNLSMVAGLISLQEAEAGSESSSQGFSKLSQRISAISLIHEKLYRSSDLTNIAFGDYVSDLCRTLILSLYVDPEAIAFELEPSNEKFSPDILIPLGLIITEIVTNSLKYAFRDRSRGSVRVSLAAMGDTCVLDVRDDGTPPSDRNTILQSRSLGAALVMNLVRQIQGTLSLDLASGTRYIIQFPRES